MNFALLAMIMFNPFFRREKKHLLTDLTDPFTILKPQDQEIGEFYVAQKRCAKDFDAPNL